MKKKGLLNHSTIFSLPDRELVQLQIKPGVVLAFLTKCRLARSVFPDLLPAGTSGNRMPLSTACINLCCTG